MVFLYPSAQRSFAEAVSLRDYILRVEFKNDLKFSQDFLPDYFMENYEDLSVRETDRFTMYGGYD